MRLITRGVYLTTFIALFNMVSSSAQSSFQIHIGSSLYDYLVAADNDRFGNTILAGTVRNQNGYSPNEGLLVKVHANGAFSQKLISPADTGMSFLTVKVLENGNYLAISDSKVYSEPPVYTMGVFIFDTAMNIIVQKSYVIPDGYLKFDGYCSMVEDNDGNLVLAASLAYKQGSTIFEDIVIYKFNQHGDTLVSKVYETWWGAGILSLSKVPNSDQLMIIGYGYLPATYGELMFLDPDLNIIRVKRLRGGSGFDTKHWLSDTTFIMSETFVEHSKNLSQERKIKVSVIETAATYLKSTELDHPDTLDYVSFGESMSYFNDTIIYISGFQSHHDLTFSLPNLVYLYIVDTNPYIRGYKAMGGDHSYDGMGVIATQDGGSLIWTVRYSIPYDGNGRDIVIWKVMPEDMTLYTHVSYLPPGKLQGHAWPNPVGDELYISLEDFVQGETIRYRITDMQGRTCLDLKQTVNGNCLHTQTHNLDTGMYIYEVSGTGKKIISGKFIKQ
jgi:hypothetical protein